MVVWCIIIIIIINNNVLYLQFVLHVMLLHTCNMCCTLMLILSGVGVQCPIWLFFVVT